MIQVATQTQIAPPESDFVVVVRAAELCNPFLDGLNEVTLSICGPVASSVCRWNAAYFHPAIRPALLEVLHRAAEGSSFEIATLDCSLDAAMPDRLRIQSRDAGKRLIAGLLAPKGERLIERYRAAVLAGDAPGHLAMIHALRAAAFHLSPRVMIASYLVQEGIGAGLGDREVDRFLLDALSAAGELSLMKTELHSLHG